MIYNDSKPLLPEQWSKIDKSILLTAQKAISGLLIFFSIVLCTNIFLLNAS